MLQKKFIILVVKAAHYPIDCFPDKKDNNKGCQGLTANT